VFWIFGQKRQDTLESLKIQKDKKELDGPVHTTVIEPKVTS
jgi:hypothetical protein